jgi:hypothetical protein
VKANLTAVLNQGINAATFLFKTDSRGRNKCVLCYPIATAALGKEGFYVFNAAVFYL